MTTSILSKSQTKTFTKVFQEHEKEHIIIVTVRYDDQCNNNHNTFSITGEIWQYHNGRKVGHDCITCGCIRDEIRKHFPQLAPFLQWHGVTSNGPLYYFQNTLYLAGTKDCSGLEKGEFRQHTSRGKHQAGGIEDVPCWELSKPEKQEVYAHEKPAPVMLEWQPSGRVGEGKERQLDAARSVAIWPDATEDDLIAPGLKERLEARLPQLMAEFRAAVESLGFIY